MAPKNSGPAAVTRWRTPRRSKALGNCVEVGQSGTGVAVRDTKLPGSPVLAVTAAGWDRFLAGIRHGQPAT
ncbi:MAG: DUF397 domain-containing protein [Actinomycetota bacterium]|nr:DUF397 domain-containing protein [Actinomycetota bacterium]